MELSLEARQRLLVAMQHPETRMTIAQAMQQHQMGDTLGEIEQALQMAQQFLPILLGAVGTVYPPAAAFAQFLPLLGVVIQGVNTVKQIQGGSTASAIVTVSNHNTPGAPNAPALNGTATNTAVPSQPGGIAPAS